MLSGLSAALGFGGRGSSEEAAAAAEGASSSGNGSDSHAPAPDAPVTMANRDSSGSSWLSSGATTPLEWTASSAEGRGLALPQGLPRLVFLPVSDSATVLSAAGAAATAEVGGWPPHKSIGVMRVLACCVCMPMRCLPPWGF